MTIKPKPGDNPRSQDKSLADEAKRKEVKGKCLEAMVQAHQGDQGVRGMAAAKVQGGYPAAGVAGLRPGERRGSADS